VSEPRHWKKFHLVGWKAPWKRKMSCLIIQFLDVSVSNKVQKIRLIDDFSDSGVNHATTTFESPSLHTVDVIAAALTEWFERSKAAGSDPELTVRTYDLKSAYRQIGLSKKGREKACIAVFDPQTKSTKLFRLCVLP